MKVAGKLLGRTEETAPAESFSTHREEDISTRLEQAKASDHPFYSRYYERLKEIGHIGCTPEFSAPTLVWHLAMWPQRTQDPQNAVLWSNEEIAEAVKQRLREIRPNKQSSGQAEGEKQEAPKANNFHDSANKQFQAHTAIIDDHLNKLLKKLQTLGRANSRRDSFERADGVADHDKVDGNVHFEHLKREEIGFTIWWADDGPLDGRAPRPDAIRVRVEVVRRPDFVTIGFYLDATAGWRSQESPARIEAHEGKRRSNILRHVANVNRICAPRLADSTAAKPLLPEELQNAEHGGELLDASLCLYDDLWREFYADFKLGSEENPEDLSAITGSAGAGTNVVGRVFGNFRGLIMPVEGLKLDQRAVPDHSGAAPFARFSSAGAFPPGAEANPNEANAVVKAYWQFIRRITPAMDYRDVVACGIMNWRCLVVTSLGSYVKDDPLDEGESLRIDIPDKSLRIDKQDHSMTLAEPVRHLFLTKGKPNPAQIGRIVERVCTMETIRLYALKDWHVLQDASVHIRILGQELDHIIHEWTVGRAHIDEECCGQRGKRKTEQSINDDRDQWIATYTRYIEERLLAIGAALDRCGQSCVGGIHYRIGRSRHYAEEFKSLLRTLRVGPIETWISYDQFAVRGLEPAFMFIDELGQRLDSLRRRLQAVMDGIEASALVAQTSATRQNTMELRKITETTRTFSRLGQIGTLGAFIYYIGLVVKIMIEAYKSGDTSDLARAGVSGILSIIFLIVFMILAMQRA